MRTASHDTTGNFDDLRLFACRGLTYCYLGFMKTITVEVDEPVYEAYVLEAQKKARETTEFIREVLEDYSRTQLGTRPNPSIFRDGFPMFNAGGPVRSITSEDQILDEMIDASRD